MASAIRTDHHVTSADGTRYRVSYVDEARQTAHLSPLEHGGESVELPLAELKRVAVRRRPPIEGLPERRARCPYCDRPLRPEVDEFNGAGVLRFAPGFDYRTPIVRRVFTGWRGYPIERGNLFEKFCTLACARDFANAAFRAGYRVRRSK